MSTTTTNLGLIKPTLSDDVDVTDLNANFDAIDAAIGNIQVDVDDDTIKINGQGQLYVALPNGYGITNDAYYTDIADAIRSKAGTSVTYEPSEMASAIDAIQAGGGDLYGLVMRTISEFSNSDVTAVADYAFYSCTSLLTVSLPACTKVGYQAFYSCTNLQTVDLPSCTSIGASAFLGCSSLTTVSLPSCTSSVGGSAFYSCYRLVSLYLNSVTSVPTLGNNAFLDTPIGGYSARAGQYGSVFVPESLAGSFMVASNWKSISARIVGV